MPKGRASLNRSAAELRVAGLTRLSTCDWPGELAAVLFCQGCGWNCGYCHNPDLRPAKSNTTLSWTDVFEFLKSRVGLLDAVVFSGGEATLQSSLPQAMKETKALGFRIGLHTAGMAPAMLETVLPLVDWVGFDAKAPWALYKNITGIENSGSLARQSLELLLHSGVAYEVRTTVHSALLSRQDLFLLREELLEMGVKHYVIQRYRETGVRKELLPAPSEELQLPDEFGAGFTSFHLR